MNFRIFFLRVPLLMLIMGAHLATSHSWLNSVEVQSRKTVGYIRGYIKNDPKHDEHNAVVMANSSYPICNIYQQKPINHPESPRLKAASGDRVIGWHWENGHVSTPSTAGMAGRTYWFGTSKPNKKHTLGYVLKWRDDGDEQGGPGQYLGAAKYDDGKCAEPNTTPISAERGVGPNGKNKACKDDGFVVPAGLKAGSVYTVYWVWDYSEHVPGSYEYYSSCLDIDIIAASSVSTTRSPYSTASTPAYAKATTYNAPTRAYEVPHGTAEPC